MDKKNELKRELTEDELNEASAGAYFDDLCKDVGKSVKQLQDNIVNPFINGELQFDSENTSYVCPKCGETIIGTDAYVNHIQTCK